MRKASKLLGQYQNFPEGTHGSARFTHKSPMEEIQHGVLSALHLLNHVACGLKAIAPYLSQECEVGFEIGVAEDFEFNFLDKMELDRFQKIVVEERCPTLDFLLVVRYHVVNDDGKRVPLKFDYHLLRFKFQGSNVELRFYHERGTQRVSLRDLATFIEKRINKELSRRQLEPLKMEYLQTKY